MGFYKCVVLMRLLQDMKVEGARLYSSALRDAGLDSQIRWLQESFDTAQTSAKAQKNLPGFLT